MMITDAFGRQMSEQEVRDNLRGAEQNFKEAKSLYRARKIKRPALLKAKHIYRIALLYYGQLINKLYSA